MYKGSQACAPCLPCDCAELSAAALVQAAWPEDVVLGFFVQAACSMQGRDVDRTHPLGCDRLAWR